MKTLILSTIVAIAAAACGQTSPSGTGDEEERPSVTTLGEPTDALSRPLMVALLQAKNFHHKADIYLKEGNLELAIDALESILDVPFPKDAPEGEDVRLDARARLAKLFIESGKLDQAGTVVDEGVSASTRESFYLANLFRVRGELLEVRARKVEESDQDAAKKYRREAITAYDRSIAINEGLLEELLPGQGERK